RLDNRQHGETCIDPAMRSSPGSWLLPPERALPRGPLSNPDLEADQNDSENEYQGPKNRYGHHAIYVLPIDVEAGAKRQPTKSHQTLLQIKSGTERNQGGGKGNQKDRDPVEDAH